MPKQVTKRCHWVPQAYLRAFAADPEGLRVWRLSKDAGEPELKRIAKVAVRHHLYVPRDADGRRDDRLERKLGGLERWLDHPIWHELGTGYMDLSWEPLRKLVSLMAATMFLRHPKQYTLARRMHSQFVEMLSSLPEPPDAMRIGGVWRPVDPDSWPAYRDASDNDVHRFWNGTIEDAAEYAEMFLKMRWSMLCSEEPVFVTSDSPLTLIHPSLALSGIRDPGTTILFPISPVRVLRLDHMHGEPANQYYRTTEDLSAAQNLLMWREADEHMFSSRHPHLVCGEMLADAERQGFA